MWRRNFSSRSQQLAGGDAVVISVPKSGRTWLRTFLSAYYSAETKREFSLDPWLHDRTIPLFVFTHDLFEHRTKGNAWDRLRGKYLLRTEDFRRARVILLVRDPRDVFVSYHAQLVHRSADTPLRVRRKSASELLRDSAHGINSMVEVMNTWLREFRQHSHFAVFRYEDFRGDPRQHFAEALRALGEETITPAAFETALEFSDFENMKQLEASGAFASDILQPADFSNPESFKVRRGKVGGFEESLSETDQAYARRAISRLDECFGYRP